MSSVPSSIAGQFAATGAALLGMLRCPVCKGALISKSEKLLCASCHKSFPIVLGIPDLRVYEDPLIPLKDDYRKGERLQKQGERLSFAELVRYYWSLPTYPPTPPELRERFIEHVLGDEARIETYRDKVGSGGAFLEAGCGTAALLKVVQPRFEVAVGCDVAFRWLVVARKRFSELGRPVDLVCCCADHLPFDEGVFSSVASVSLLEHVSDPSAVVREAGRVARDEGRVFVYTTNRFSLLPEPHVRVWGVGFLPRSWMPAYVKWRSGLDYSKKHLLSRIGVRRLFREHGFRDIQFSLPRATAADWKHFSRMERLGARIFGWVAKVPVLRAMLTVVSPVIQAAGRRRRHGKGAAAGAGDRDAATRFGGRTRGHQDGLACL